MAGFAIGSAAIGSAAGDMYGSSGEASPYNRMFSISAIFDKFDAEAACFAKSAVTAARYDKRADISVTIIL